MAKENSKAKKSKPAEEQLTVDQHKQQLLARAKKEGHIEQRDIFLAIPETAENAEILDSLYTELADANLEITTTEPNPENFTDEWEAEEAEEEAPTSTTAVYLDDDVADDSVRLYLREIGKIPLLNAEEELALAQRVVSGDKDGRGKHATCRLNSQALRWPGTGFARFDPRG